MKTDAAFRGRVLAVGDVDQRLALLRDEGYDCTAEELETEGGRLDAAELDGVSGGANTPICDCPQATPRFACFSAT